jgi:phosphatidylserine/phosphatidylglycerophosphate/cardiolipin synthase-like enzyme
MESKIVGATLTVRAIAGLHVVFLAWDFTHGLPDSASSDLLGFAVEREELDDTGTVIERYMLRGTKRFQGKDEGMEPGMPVPTDEHPIQSFQWGDYTARPGATYRYRVVPVCGQPKLLMLRDDEAVTVEVGTEREEGSVEGTGLRHDIYFNRGAAASQAFVRRFKGQYIVKGKFTADGSDTTIEPMLWLSRGLFEGLRRFLECATDSTFTLKGMLYEFHYLPAVRLFKEAADRGVTVDIRYEAQTYREDNEATIHDADLEQHSKPQAVRGGIRHNKFVVLLQNGMPKAVWTGSTNLSLGGIYGHSNVGHAVWDEGVAGRFHTYWEALAADNVKTAALRKATVKAPMGCATPGGLPATGEVLTLFSPRDAADKAKPAVTLEWYAALIAKAGEVVCLTLPFNFDEVLRKSIAVQNDVLRMVVLDKKLSDEEAATITVDHDTLIAAGSKLDAGELQCFAKEYLTGFNKNNYIHDKFLLIDPHGEDPIVITGSANFSGPSQRENDENMLVIRGDKRVARIYFGEFLRIFDHLYARYLAEKLKRLGLNDPNAGYLKETTAKWLDGQRSGYKAKRRTYFVNPTRRVQ